MSRWLTPRRLLGAGLALLVLTVGVSWLLPSDSYLFEPNEAHPLAGKVKVEGARPDDDGGGVYYVDVTVRKASWLERLVAPLRPDGATLAPAEAVVPEGSSFDDRRRAARLEMKRSEEVAAAVALREAGFDVPAKPRGALVVTVAPDVPAASVLEDGDVIVAVAGEPVRTPGDLRERVGAATPGSELELRVLRDGKPVTLGVTTVESPSEPGRSVIGIRVAQDANVKLPIEVDIDLGDVGGPSAGLAFALETLEQLGRDVDGGRRVVATGELELDGSVGPVGGLKQKTLGAREAHADVFLVPAGDNADEARRYAGDLRIVPVENFQQALRALATTPAAA